MEFLEISGSNLIEKEIISKIVEGFVERKTMTLIAGEISIIFHPCPTSGFVPHNQNISATYFHPIKEGGS